MKPKKVTKAIIDADIIGYRAAAGTEGSPPKDTIDKVDALMEYVIGETVAFPSSNNLECYLTGKDNFRYEVAKTAPYKGNRKDVAKPTNLPAARDHLVNKWGAVVSQGEEADDLIAMAATMGDPKTTVICSIDKDFLTVPCWMFNFVKSTWKYSTEDEARKYFYTQILTGDNADNIKGIYRVGPVKAGKLLEGLTTEEELYKACLEAYMNYSDEHRGKAEYPIWKYAEDRVLENARLLWLRRYDGQMWEAPK